MKIAFLSFYQGFVSRGVETFVSELSSRLPGTVKIYRADKEINVKDTANTLPRKFFLDDLSLKIALFTIKCFFPLLKNKYDIIIPTNGGWQTLLCKIACKLSGAKLVISGQSGIGFDDRWNLLMRPDLFIALSSPQENWAKKYLKNVTKIPNGVDPDKFNPSLEPVEIPLKRPIVLCVSALTDQKRVELAIEAVAKLSDTSLLVIGAGTNKNKIEILGKKLLGNRFSLLEISHDKIAPYYRAADIFTLPSASSEAFGIVLVEAMASNLPVVATNDQVRRDIIGNAGILVNPENIDEYSAGLQKTLEINWGNKPRIQSQNFLWDKIAKNYEEAFKKIPQH
jgi:glycosyltransferase involved in cell wall biosynthesis